MAKYATVSTTRAWGHTTPYGLKQIAVRISVTIFDKLKARALKENSSMNAKIADYIEVGLAVDEDWDEDEPERHQR